MTWCYASDLHGHESLYLELAGLFESRHCDTVILGGDLLPRKGGGPAGLELQAGFASTFLREFTVRICGKAGGRVYAIPGNDDWIGAGPSLRGLESEGLILLPADRSVPVPGGFHLRGYPFVPPTPFLLKDFEKRDLSRDAPPGFPGRIFATVDGRIGETDAVPFFSGRTAIEDDLAAWILGDECGQTVCVMHGPPFGTSLDRLADGRPAGSRAVRDFLMRENPLLSLHGHIHESADASGEWAQRIGKTLSVNPGQRGGRLSAVWFDPSDPAGSMTHTVYGPFQPRDRS
ncbi:metallophosphoesterase [bacterium]|nr:metallophosphoesterase [bacterium]